MTSPKNPRNPEARSQHSHRNRTAKNRLRYWFDNLMSKGTISLILMLALATAVVVVVAGLISAAIGGSDHEAVTVGGGIWNSLMHTLSTSSLTKDGGNFWYVVVMTVVTICGLLITSMLIALITSGFREKIQALRRGRSVVLEDDHIVVLGFDESAVNVVGEMLLCQDVPAVVVMAPRSKTDMEDQLRERFEDFGNMRVVCRSGEIDSVDDLRICSLGTCRAVVVCGDDDFMTIKSLLACVNLLESTGNPRAHITAVIHEATNVRPARIAGGDRAEIVYSKRAIARLMVQSARQPGMSVAFNELLSFKGHEIYSRTVPELRGKTISEANLLLQRAVVIGLVRDGIPLLNPVAETSILSKDEVILVAPHRRAIALRPQPLDPRPELWAPVCSAAPQPTTTLILGNDVLLPQIILEEDAYAAPGSRVIVAAEPGSLDRAGLPQQQDLRNVTMEFDECDIFEHRELERLMANRPDAVMLLADRRRPDAQSDARVLTLQLQLHTIVEDSDDDFTVAIEMRNIRNQELAQVSYATDFVVSHKVAALMMSQIAHDRHAHAILDDLLDADGSELYMKPASRYVAPDVEVDFATILASAARFGEIAIGFRHLADDGTGYEIVLNPEKNAAVTLSERDAVMVVAHR